jgi:uncharacterized protein (UPF0218 family)
VGRQIMFNLLRDMSILVQNGEEDCIPVTTSLYLPSQGRIVCGREDGSIVIISAAKAALTQLFRSRRNREPPGNVHSCS